jgi:hypothetical protein
MRKDERDLIALFISKIERALEKHEQEVQWSLNQLRKVAGLEEKS